MSTTAPERTTTRLAVTPLRDIVVRDATATGDGSWTIEGYAAVTEQETTLWEIPGWVRVREEIARGAFESVLSRLAHGDGLVHLNHGHDMKTAVAATDVRGIGSLELAEDFHGLRFFSRVDPDDDDARKLATKMRRGVVKQASFAFTIADEEIVEHELLDDGTEDLKYRIVQIGDLYDVCACAQGAYAQTESSIRSLAAASLRVPDLGAPGRSLAGEGRPGRTPEGVGSIQVAPASAGPVASVSLLRAKASDIDRRLRLEGAK